MSGVDGWQVGVKVRHHQDAVRLGPRRAGHHSQEETVVGDLRYFPVPHRA